MIDTSMDVNPGETQRVEFSGKAGEWFGIWIVNLLLSIVTLGIYSAWAKVRTKKYFYNNTSIAGRNFDYHATGKQILIGRIIVAVGFIAFSLLSAVPVLNIIVILGFLAALPWLIVKSLQFNARMSSFSNVRFNFIGKMGGAFMTYVLLPLGLYILVGVVGAGGAFLAAQSGSVSLGVLTVVAVLAVIFFALPYVDRAIKRFVINHHRLGKAAFQFDAGLSPFAKALGLALAWIVVVLVLSGVFFGASFAAFGDMFLALDGGGEPTAGQLGLIGLVYLLFFVAFLPAGFIYQALTRNIMYDNTQLEGGHTFRSTVKVAPLMWIAVSNAFVVVLSLGLMLPWSQIRMQAYLASQTFVIPGASLDDFIGEQQAASNAIGDAYGDLEGVDFGVGL